MKRGIRLFALLCLVAIALSTTGCWLLLPNFRRAAFGLAGAVLELPGAVVRKVDAATGSYVSPRSSDSVIASVQDIFTPVRDNYNEIANNALKFTRDLLTDIDTNLFNNRQLMDYLEENGSVVFNDGLVAWRIVQDTNDYTVQGWEFTGGAWHRVISVMFTAEGDRLYGEVVAIHDPADLSSPTYRVSFDNADADLGASVTELEAVNLDYGVPATQVFNIPTKLWIKATASGEVFRIAASVLYTEVNLDDGQESQLYLNDLLNSAAIGDYVNDEPGIEGLYQYRGVFQVNAEYDRGYIDLALVPMWTSPTIDEFTDYSVGALWKEGIANWIRATPDLITNINAATTTEPDISAGSNTGDIFAALVDVQDSLGEGESSELDNLLFVILLTNPAYFDNQEADSFVGTAELNTPAWVNELPAVDPLEIEMNQETMPGMSVDFGLMAAEPDAQTEF